MSKRPFILFGFLALVCVLVLPFIALGKEGDEEAGDGQGRLAGPAPRRTSSRPTAAPATRSPPPAPTASSGPNLDQLLVPSGTNSAQLYEGNADPRHARRSQCGIGGRMPQGILEEEEAQQAAAFVAAYAGQIGKGPVVDTADRQAARAHPPAERTRAALATRRCRLLKRCACACTYLLD